MKEKLIIKNFGPIKSVELELGRFNVLIGDNGTGKSIVAKVLACIYDQLENPEGGGATGGINTRELNTLSYFKKKLSVYKIDRYLARKSVIHFIRENVFFDLENENVSTNIDDLLYRDYSLNNITTYIPADRIATSLFSSATWPALIDVEEGRIDMPKYFLRFINLFERLKKEREYDFTEILGIKFRQDDGIDKVILEDGTIISIQESASAIQSNLSLSVIIDHQANIGRKKTFIIEEPELNLFPAAQNRLIQYLVDKTINYGNSILITTHSPYSLTSVNNLIYAYEVGQNHPEEVHRIIDKKYWLNPSDVKAYRLIEDESEKIIMDEEMNMIEAGEVDEISRSLNDIFDKIGNIEYSTVSES